jgi:hypothetical protein
MRPEAYEAVKSAGPGGYEAMSFSEAWAYEAMRPEAMEL